MANKATSKKASKQVMDVARPGKTTPSSSSRPIIVGHGSMIKDPMMSSSKTVAVSDGTEDKGESIAITRSAKTIAPLAAADEKAAKSRAKKPIEIVPPETPASPEPEAPAEAVTPEPTSPEPPAEETPPEPEQETPAPAEASDEAAVDALAGQVKDKKQETKESEEARQKQAELEKLIEEKKYFVPLSQVTHRRHTIWTLALLFMLLLAIAAAAYAIDAELFDPGFDLPFDLIKV